MRAFLAAIRFLTILPIPGDCGTDAADLARSVPLFPVVGLLLGALAAGAAWALGRVAPPLVAAALIVVLLMSFSGCLHLDGLADSADALLSSRTRERMLEIMKDSHTGAMGVIAIVAVLLVKFAALASLRPTMLAAAVLLMPPAGRAAIVVHMAVLPYVREKGLGTPFCQSRPAAAAAWSMLVLAGVAGGLLGWLGLAVWAFCLALICAMAAYFYRKIGGATGDTFGALCEVVETVPAVVLAVWCGGGMK